MIGTYNEYFEAIGCGQARAVAEVSLPDGRHLHHAVFIHIGDSAAAREAAMAACRLQLAAAWDRANAEEVA